MSGRARPNEGWLWARRDGAIRSLRSAISATGLEHHREGFGWRVRPAPGSILASPRQASWTPEPDYFHHWVRDAAIAVRAFPEVMAAVDAGEVPWWEQAFRDHLAFSLTLGDPGRRGPARNPVAAGTGAGHRRYLRPDAELASLTEGAWLEEPRFAADGGPDLERWNRPQDDGPALRAAAVLRVIAARPALRDEAAEWLVARDLDHTCAVAGRACIGPWEEEPPRRTTFTLIAQWDALDRGAAWRRDRGEDAEAERLTTAAARVAALIEAAADPARPAWRESVEGEGVDAATVLAVLHADRDSGSLALDAPRTLGTLAILERQFAALYPINRGRPVPAMGRWQGDAYFGGNPWFPVTLGCAELHYRIAARTRATWAWDKAEAWMALAEEVAPEGDALPEQFDRVTGAPVSCLALTWSAAAFVGAVAARETARQAMASR